ncbi:MAG TPA: hypothetical protein VHX86_08535 [Tepidisphaeraceae bacterium]|jgi:hypothetical protein|nr:hypothetical protein [Tepidisphaeraceae bacterium]
MEAGQIQELCQLGQQQLQRMEYLQAEQTLAAAEKLAWDGRDFDAMARLYMPLQEARRQRRQRCGEGIIRLDFLAGGPADQIDGRAVIETFPHGQFLIAGWGSIQPALDARREQTKRGLYADVFLAAVYPAQAGRIVAIVPSEDVALPPAEPMPVDVLIRRLPAHSVVMADAELPPGTYGAVMDIWEHLHAPFLAAAESIADPIRKIDAYRKSIRVDYACELAHQGISNAARQLCNTESRLS